jgi:putative oxidoreductase
VLWRLLTGALDIPQQVAEYGASRKVFISRGSMNSNARHNPGRPARVLSWTLRLIAAVILLQTLYFKFTGAEESVYIFSTVGKSLGIGSVEPWGRIGSGVVELVASILLLLPRTAAFGAILSLATMTGALFFHLTSLGIALPIAGDNGELFMLAVIVFVCSLGVLILHRRQLPVPAFRT